MLNLENPNRNHRIAWNDVPSTQCASGAESIAVSQERESDQRETIPQGRGGRGMITNSDIQIAYERTDDKRRNPADYPIINTKGKSTYILSCQCTKRKRTLRADYSIIIAIGAHSAHKISAGESSSNPSHHSARLALQSHIASTRLREFGSCFRCQSTSPPEIF